MKIQRFNEKYNYDVDNYIPSNELPNKVNSFILDLNGNLDTNIIEWVSDISKSTKLKEYSNITKSEKMSLDFSESKKLEKLKSLINKNKEIGELEKRIKLLVKEKERLHTEACSEVLYNFQKDLINSDFDTFYKKFISEEVDDYIEGYEDEIFYSDVHPQIMKEYGDKIKNYVEILISSKKYNL